MIRQIFKYQIDPKYMAGQHSIPKDSFFLDLQVQKGIPTMWWSVPWKYDPKENILRTFVVAPTGPPGYADHVHYVGTFQLHDGDFVGHLMSYEEIPRVPTPNERG